MSLYPRPDRLVLGLDDIAFVFFWALAFDFQLVAAFTAWFDPVLADTIHFVHDIALVGLAAIPVGLYVLGQLNFQAALADEHAELGHYATVTYYGPSILALGVLASLKNRGRRWS